MTNRHRVAFFIIVIFLAAFFSLMFSSASHFFYLCLSFLVFYADADVVMVGKEIFND